MNRPGRFFLILAGVTLVAAAASAEQAKPAVTPPAATTQKPNDEAAAPKKLVAPVRGEALIGYLKPVTKQDKNMIITTIRIKNLSPGAIAGLKVDEFWYDKDGNPVTGAQPFRWRKPLQPGEVIDVVLQVPRNPNMNRNQYKFEHANGTIKTQLMPKL
jgi:hypothetical protein